MEQPTKKEKGLTKRIEEKEIHQIGKRRSRSVGSQKPRVSQERNGQVS